MEGGNSRFNPFEEEPICKLNNIRESSAGSELVSIKSFPNNEGLFDDRRRIKRLETPSTPGRPVFNFSHSRKNVPSKWDDAEKWLINTSPPPSTLLESCSKVHKKENVSNFELESMLDHNSGHVLLKDKLTNDVEPIVPKLRFSEPYKEGSETRVFREVEHRDIGTEMSPLASKCHTPGKGSSPARHNTPASRSGPLAFYGSTIDITQLQECHLAKLNMGSQYDSNWTSRAEEEKEISQSLRHFELGIVCTQKVPDSRAAAWEEEEKNKCCIRYQREEAKIQAWVNIQNAKAEAQLMKLEVKIEKMRSSLEEKSMKRMTIVERKAEEWRASARKQHNEHLRKASEDAQKIINRQIPHLPSHHTTCGCLPCNKTF
ncbi:hypothetical protein ACFE04_021684 [Oxalis oulophora]